MNLSAMQSARTTAGARYAAVAELQASLVDLAALDQALSNRNVATNNAPDVPPGDLYDRSFGGNHANAEKPTFRKLPASLTELEHQQYAPALRDRLADAIRAARDSYISGFAP